MFQRQKKNEKLLPQLTFHSSSQNPSPVRYPLKKKRKRNINDVPKTKKNEILLPPAYLS
jgi:hypothetical protein